LKTEIKNLEKRLDQMNPKDEQVYRKGFLDGQRENIHFYSHLPFIFQQTIMEYLTSQEEQCLGPGDYYPKTKQEALEWFTNLMKKELDTATELISFIGKGSTMYKCPNCAVEYHSNLLMAHHMFSNHAIQTSKK
jgi:hypothetical protein